MKPKRIGIDLFDIRNMYVGVGEFSYRLGEQMALKAKKLRDEHGIELVFFVSPRYKGVFGHRVSYRLVGPVGRLFTRFAMRRYDLFHSVHQYARMTPPWTTRKRLLTIHDLNFLYEKSESKKKKYYNRIRRRIAASDLVTFISSFVERDVRKNYDIRIPGEVIPNGVTNLTGIALHHEKEFNREGYLFHISGISPKKNVHLLVEMMRFLPGEKLIIAGNTKSAYAAGLRRRVEELGLENVEFAGNVDLATKALMYHNCKAFLFPSLCEGFGLPPVEAMCFGKPVFLSTLSSLPEVGGTAAYYWPSLEPEEMAGVVGRALTAPDEAHSPENIRKWASNFTWDKCAGRYLDLYVRMLEEVPGK